jgi:hypothetical protein
MSLKFNLNRPKLSDEEINAHRDFDGLIKKFKEESLKKARGDESWWKNKKITYSAIIAGMTVVCTITYLSLKTNNQNKNQKHETLTTQNKITNSKVNNTKFINPPTKQLNVQYQNYKVNNSTGALIKHPSKSQIKIPKNCFIDKNGQNIVGEVTIQYREINGLPEIIASGIPMHYDSANNHYNLESAGMFEIKGFQNQEPIYIHPQKSIQVSYASDNPQNKFNQYFLDTNARNWHYLKRDDISSAASLHANQLPKNSDQIIQTLTESIEKTIPKKIDSIKLVCYKKIENIAPINKPSAPIKQTPGNPIFSLEGSPEEFPELSAFENVVFEVGKENKNYSKELTAITWSDLKITQGPQKGKNYLLHLSYREKRESLVVYPVFTTKDYDKALIVYETKLKEYNRLSDKKANEEKRLVQEMEAKQAACMKEQKEKQIELDKLRNNKLTYEKNLALNNLSTNFSNMSNQNKTQRIFEVFNFGIYNSDCAKDIPTDNTTKPIFVSLETKKPILPDMVYLVNKSQSTVLGLSKENGFEFGYNINDDYLICVFNKNEILLCSADLFKTSINSDKHQFLVNPITAQAKNLSDFKKALAL